MESWDSLKKYWSKFSSELLTGISDNNIIKVFKLTGVPKVVDFSVFIQTDFSIDASKGKKIQFVIWHMQLFNTSPVKVKSKLYFAGRHVLSILDDLLVHDIVDEQKIPPYNISRITTFELL